VPTPVDHAAIDVRLHIERMFPAIALPWQVIPAATLRLINRLNQVFLEDFRDIPVSRDDDVNDRHYGAALRIVSTEPSGKTWISSSVWSASMLSNSSDRKSVV